MINCIYHPEFDMRVVDDDEYEKLLATGQWYKHPDEAKQMRGKENERTIRKQRSKKHETAPSTQRSEP